MHVHRRRRLLPSTGTGCRLAFIHWVLPLYLASKGLQARRAACIHRSHRMVPLHPSGAPRHSSTCHFHSSACLFHSANLAPLFTRTLFTRAPTCCTLAHTPVAPPLMSMLCPQPPRQAFACGRMPSPAALSPCSPAWCLLQPSKLCTVLQLPPPQQRPLSPLFDSGPCALPEHAFIQPVHYKGPAVCVWVGGVGGGRTSGVVYSKGGRGRERAGVHVLTGM